MSKIYLMSTKFMYREKVTLGWDRYLNGRPCLQLLSVEPIRGELFATASTNIPEAHLEEGEILIKDWSENTGILAELVRHKIVEDTGRRVRTGHVEAAVCRLLVKPRG